MRRFVALLVPAVVVALLPSGLARAVGSPPPRASAASPQTVRLYDGDTITLNASGMGWRTGSAGRRHPVAIVDPQGHSGYGDKWGPTSAQIAQQFAARDRGMWAKNQVILVFGDGVRPSGGALPGGMGLRALTNDSSVNSALRVLRAASLRPAFSASGALASGPSLSRLSALTNAARARLGSRAIDLANVYVAQVAAAGPAQAAQVLRATPGVAFAEPDWTVSTMNTGSKPIKSGILPSARSVQHRAAPVIRNAASGSTLPANFGLTSSLQSYLNANGVNAASAFTSIGQRFGQLPGQGETITNVSLGDLTDESMAQGGDGYVQYYGPTTIVSNGQRYLDYPSLPLIPTYVAQDSGGLNPLGTVEGVDPSLGEALLDFSVMAPLPHDQQRPDATGAGATDLLGIAPGASYRLVEPQTPSFSDIDNALLAAAQQTPAPNVITASLGYAFDQYGFAGRYLEDDPIAQTIIAGIVGGDGIVVCIAANDGTRMYTQATVGPDGGSVATDLARRDQPATSVADDGLSTTPSEVPDSGAFAVGGTTLDDTIAVPPQDGGRRSSNPTWAEARIDGATNFSSGFGTRINVSAPSDNIAALMHQCLAFNACQPTDAIPVLDGGTSAAGPMTAAAAAVVLQVARLTGQQMNPFSVRALLEHTGRAVPTPPQIDRSLQVGPQINVGAAVDTLLARSAVGAPRPQIARFSIAHRQALGSLGAYFVEATDPTAIDLAGPYLDGYGDIGEDTVGPITFGVDGPGISEPGLSYALTVGNSTFGSSLPYVRVTPAQLFAAAQQPLVSADPRSFPVTFEVLRRGHVLTSATQQLTFGPADGTHAVAPAPVVPPVVQQGRDVTVRYDLTNVRNLSSPQLLVSSIGHWSPSAAPDFRVAYSVPLTALSGTVTIPASVFASGGAGLYGVGIEQNTPGRSVGAFASLRVDAGTGGARPGAPLLWAPRQPVGHQIEVSRTHPRFGLSWDVTDIPHATGAMLEVSAPGPTITGLYNTFTNANGSQRDDNGGDTGSVVYTPLPGKSGNIVLNALDLGLSTSLDYSVRVLASSRGSVIGQASGSSFLQIDDGLAPGGSIVDDFSIVPGGGSTVATSSYDGNGNLSGSALQAYDPSAGTYGHAFASDSTGQNEYFVFGSDPSLHRTLAAQRSITGAVDVQLYDSSTGQQVSDVPMDGSSPYQLWGGRVDTVRHRAVLLTRTASGNVDTLLPLDMSTGTPGTPLSADNGARPGTYTAMDIDSSTGNVVLAQTILGDFCAIRPGDVTVADLDTGTVQPAVNAGHCLTGVVSDQAGGNAYVTYGPLYAYPNLLSTGYWSSVSESSLTLGSRQPLGANSALFPIVDPVHHVAVVGFLATADYLTNNNAMSAVGVFDLNTGKLESLSPNFNFVAAGLGGAGYYSMAEQGIQLDPATRTAWTYGPGVTEIQQFGY